MSREARLAAFLALLALFAAGCQDDDSGPAELPSAVAETRSEILSAAEKRDYDRLRALIPDFFVSDYSDQGPPDPAERWRRQGQKPLETMDVLLRMPHQVRETNEGTLYQWPRFGPNSKPGDISDSGRAMFRRVMTEAEVRELILPEYGYVAPRLGILADGTWWFFVLEGGP
jgi:hypothetical protein